MRVVAVLVVLLVTSGLDVGAASFPGEKTLESGPDPVGLKKTATSVFIYEISLTPPIPSGSSVVDRVPAEFDIHPICSDGTVGDLCDTDTDCDIPGTCVFTDLCVAGDVGATCGTNDDCTIDGLCDPIQECTEGTVGNACGASIDCEIDGICDFVKECTAGNVGNPCGADFDCEIDGICQFVQQCTEGNVGNACGADVDCEIYGICDFTQACTTGDVGQPCGSDSDCVLAGICDLSENDCLFGDVGTYCESDSDCDIPGDCPSPICSQGRVGELCSGDVDCDIPGTCPPPTCDQGRVGEPCSSDAQCDIAGVCPPPICAEGRVGELCGGDAECDIVGDCEPIGECASGLTGESCNSNDDCTDPGTCSAGLPSCGDVSATEIGKPSLKLRPDEITWDLDGCDLSSSQSLLVAATTDLNPGAQSKGKTEYEPTTCGPLVINNGAKLVDSTTGTGKSALSNRLSVATCKKEGTARCVDADGDGWSVDCGDCNDADPSIHPKALDPCGDGKDANCDGRDACRLVL